MAGAWGRCSVADPVTCSRLNQAVEASLLNWSRYLESVALEKCENSGVNDCGGNYGFISEDTLYQEAHPSTYLLSNP